MATHSDNPHQESFAPAVLPVERGDMGIEVAAAKAAGDPADYAGRYTFNMNNGQIVPAQADAMPSALKQVRFEQDHHGKITAFMPSLATGSVVDYGPAGSVGSDYLREYTDQMEKAGIHNNDGKQDMRKSRLYWKKDPLNYRCAGFLAELMNTNLTIECEDEAFRDVVEIWLTHAMGHVFRDQFFRELVVTGMVPVFKTLIPYQPRAYRYNRAPRPTTEQGNVDQPRLATARQQHANAGAFSGMYLNNSYPRGERGGGGYAATPVSLVAVSNATSGRGQQASGFR